MSPMKVIGKRFGNKDRSGCEGNIYTSEYQDEFHAWPWEPPRHSLKPTVIRGVSTLSYPPDMVSCTHRTFVPHNPVGPPRKSYKPKVKEVAIPGVKMDTSTTYALEYSEKTIQPRPPSFKLGDKLADNKLFNTETVYQAQFKGFSRDEIEDCKVERKPHPDNLGKEQKPVFSARSTAQDSFYPPGLIAPVSSLKPDENTHIDRTQPLETETTQRAAFKPQKPLLPPSGAKSQSPPASQQPPAPSSGIANGNPLAKATSDLAKNPTTTTTIKCRCRDYKPARERFDGLSISKRDFVAHRMTKPAKSYQPKQVYRRNQAKFDGRTTQRMSYQPITIAPYRSRPPARKHRVAVLSKAQGARLELNTSYQDAFTDPDRLIPLEKCRRVSYKLENSGAGSGAGAAGGDKHAPMEVETSYSTSYVPHEKVKRTESYKITPKYSLPRAPFYGQSTSGAHYRGMPSPPAKTCKPQVRPRSSPGKMSNLTTYRVTFGHNGGSFSLVPPTRKVCSKPPAATADGTEKAGKMSPTMVVPHNTPVNTTPTASTN